MSETKERETIKLGEEEYYVDSLDPASNQALGDIRVIDAEIGKHQLAINIASIAKGTISKSVLDKVDTFEKVLSTESKEVPEVPVA